MEIRDIAEGLWIWRLEHPHWRPGQGWDPLVTCTCVTSRGETLLLDPLAPPRAVGSSGDQMLGAALLSAGIPLPRSLDPPAPQPRAVDAPLWRRLDAHPPTAVVVLKPDHVRDVDVFVRRYHVRERAYGPRLFFRCDIPETELRPIDPGSELPGGLVALYDGRGRNETPLWLPEQRTLVFADALTAPHGELRVWATPWHRERALPALRALLDLPFQCVIVSHGEPVHTRAEYERALEREPWSGRRSCGAGNLACGPAF